MLTFSPLRMNFFASFTFPNRASKSTRQESGKSLGIHRLEAVCIPVASGSAWAVSPILKGSHTTNKVGMSFEDNRPSSPYHIMSGHLGDIRRCGLLNFDDCV